MIAGDNELFVHQSEVELSLLLVSPGYLYADGIAQLILVMAATSYEAVVALVEVIVVVVEVAYGHHAFAVVFVYLAVDAVAGDAADVCGIGLA